MNEYTIIFGLFIILQLFIFKLVATLQQKPLRLSYEECIGILDETMKREFKLRYKLEYELKNLTMFYDFKEDLSELVQATLVSFNEPLMKELELYYNRTYIIKYVTRNMELMLMQFIKEKKIQTK